MQEILKGVNLTSQLIDLPELQGEPEEIAQKKVEEAFRILQKPVMVEDTSLCFESYQGLPGPYIKDFLLKLGVEKLAQMANCFGDNRAYAQCIFALKMSAEEKPHIFVGQTKGRIVNPRGNQNFGWDCVFEPEGFDKTFGELDGATKNTISHRYKALSKLLSFLKK